MNIPAWIILGVSLCTILGILFHEHYQRRILEEKLEDSRKAIQTAVECSDMLFFEYYPECHLAVMLNDPNDMIKEKELHNYPQCWYDRRMIHPDDIGKSIEMFRKIDDGAVRAEAEYRCLNNNEYHWYQYRMQSMYDNFGERIKVIVTRLDITIRKEMELVYQKHLNALFFEKPDTILSCRMNLTSNQVLSFYSVYKSLRNHLFVASTFDDMLGKLASYVTLESRNTCLELFSREHLIQEFSKGNSVVGSPVSYMVGKDIRWAYVTVEMMREAKRGEIDAVLHVQDRTYQRITELLLESAASHDYDFLTFVFGKTQKFIRYNWLGYQDFSLQENYGKQLLDYIDFLDADDKEEVLENLAFENILENLHQYGEYTVYHTVYQADGMRKRKKIQFFYVDDGEELILASQHDITDIFEAEQRQKEVLADALEEAKAANLAKTDFLSRMSHDIRTPMNAIIGITSLALDEVDKPEKVEANLTKINSASHFLLGLINDILDMTKIEDGSVELHREPYEYEDFIGNIRTMFEPLCQKNGIQFIIHEQGVWTTFMTDIVRLNQIFFNIISNAVKYTKEGGSIIYREENVDIQDNIASIDFVVEDTGIGMSKEFMQKMFQPFTQESNAYTTNIQGTGLGLSITKSLVELMGGRIEIESEVGKGTKVIIHLSFEIAYENERKVAQIKEKKALDDEVLKNKRILLVEDHPLNTEIAKRVLEKKKMIVYTAENGKVAVEKFKGSDLYFFDAVLMDIRMPEMDGLEATRVIRNLPREDAATVPILAMTANAYDEDVQMSKEAGMDMHLSKPIEADKVYEGLSMMLKKSEKELQIHKKYDTLL